MRKLIGMSLICAVSLGLAACGEKVADNAASDTQDTMDAMQSAADDAVEAADSAAEGAMADDATGAMADSAKGAMADGDAMVDKMDDKATDAVK